MGSLVYVPGAALRMLERKPAHVHFQNLKMCNRCYFAYLQKYAKIWEKPLTIKLPDSGGYDISIGGFWEAWLTGLGKVCECNNSKLPEVCKC
jgi:hypothetical protein